MTKEQIPTINTKELIDNLNPQREELDESFEDYKTRMKRNKTIIKAKQVQWNRAGNNRDMFLKYLSPKSSWYR